MADVFLRVKGIIKKDNKYLIIKRWMDDRIPDPFVWEFIDGEVEYGEAPDDAIGRLIREYLGVEGRIEHLEYTWSQMLGDTHCVGIAYLCSIYAQDEEIELAEDFGAIEWISRDEFRDYIENMYVLNDLEDKKL